MKYKPLTLSHSEKRLFAVMAIILLLCYMFSFWVITNYISMICMFVLLLAFYQNSYAFIVKYFYAAFGMVVSLAGVFVIEVMPSFYLLELRIHSHRAGSLPVLCLAYLVFWFSVKLTDKKVGIEESEFSVDRDGLTKHLFVCDLLSVCFGMAFVLAFLKVLRNPSFLMGMDRFTYSTNFAVGGTVGILIKIASFLLIFPIISIIYGNRKIGVFAMLFYVLYCVWTGEKFGPFFNILIFTCLVLYKRIVQVNAKKARRIISAIGIGMIVLILAAAFLFGFVQKQDSYLYNRLAQQGQLWWRTYDLCGADGLHFYELRNEITAPYRGSANVAENVGANNGIYQIMYYTAPKYVIDDKISRGARYTEAGFAAAYYYLGILGVALFASIMGILEAFLTNKLLKAISEGRIISIILYGRLFNIARTAFSMFEFRSFLDFESIASYVYLVLFEKVKSTVFIKGIKKRKRICIR